jgi:hypothetical protein
VFGYDEPLLARLVLSGKRPATRRPIEIHRAASSTSSGTGASP